MKKKTEKTNNQSVAQTIPTLAQCHFKKCPTWRRGVENTRPNNYANTISAGGQSFHIGKIILHLLLPLIPYLIPPVFRFLFHPNPTPEYDAIESSKTTSRVMKYYLPNPLPSRPESVHSRPEYAPANLLHL